MNLNWELEADAKFRLSCWEWCNTTQQHGNKKVPNKHKWSSGDREQLFVLIVWHEAQPIWRCKDASVLEFCRRKTSVSPNTSAARGQVEISYSLMCIKTRHCDVWLEQKASIKHVLNRLTRYCWWSPGCLVPASVAWFDPWMDETQEDRFSLTLVCQDCSTITKQSYWGCWHARKLVKEKLQRALLPSSNPGVWDEPTWGCPSTCWLGTRGDRCQLNLCSLD